jgi:hypothetical protein
MPSFWVKGPEIYEKALREEYRAASERLKTQVRECTDAVQRQVLEKELETLKKDLESRLRAAGRSLF